MFSSLRKLLIVILLSFLSFPLFINIAYTILPLDIKIDTGTIYLEEKLRNFIH
jgi:hypothetical protein